MHAAPFPRAALIHTVPPSFAKRPRILLGTVLLAAALAAPAAVPERLAAQAAPWALREGLPAGTGLDAYLRALQVAGLAPWYPWTVRGLAPAELARVVPAGEHPWQGRYDLRLAPAAETPEWGWVRPEVRGLFNSAFPYGGNDGAAWVGKGFTGVATVGAFLRWGPVHVRLAPEAFWAQNAAFDLADNGATGIRRFRDGRIPGRIDLPQRFGDEAYMRVDLGTSQASLALPGVSLGFSGASEVWGPSVTYPLLLGSNAGGFPHAFLGTHALDVGIGQLRGRFLVGRLDQSDWSPVTDGPTGRVVSAATLTFSPRGVRGLELGVHRLVSSAWLPGGPTRHQVFSPFGGIVNAPETDDTINLQTENQLGGGFLRWKVFDSGVEVWVEAIREDYARDWRHYAVEPDDLLSRTLGIQRTLNLAGNRLLVLRGEVVSAELSHSERGDRYKEGRPVGARPRYVHGGVPQGHTQRGQLLGSPAAYGGSGWTVGADLYAPSGRWSWELFRELRQDWVASLPLEGTDVADVLYGLRVEHVRFGDGWALVTTVAPSVDLNRNVVRGNDVFNLNVAFGVRGLPR